MVDHGTGRSRNRQSRWITVACCALMIMAVVLPIALGNRTPSASAAVLISPQDKWHAVPRGTPEKVVRFAQEKQSLRFAEVRAYIYEVYRLAPLVGMDPALIISQSALETGNWTSFYWETYLNPAGIGIGYTGAPSYTWTTGAASARNQIVRLYIYSAGPIETGNPLYPYRNDGPSYQRLFDLGYDGQAQVLDDLTGRWATDPLYGQKVASRGSGIYAADAGDPVEPAVSPVSADTSSGGNPARTRDGDLGTTFAVLGTDTPPPGAWIAYDFGQSVVLSSIQWVFRRSGYADQYRLESSNDGTTWTPRGWYGNPSAWSWQIYGGSLTTRHLRLIFENPNGDLNVGYLAEVEFYGHNAAGVPTATSTPYPKPTATNTPIPTNTPVASNTPAPTMTPAVLDGEVIAAVRSGGSSSGNWSGYVRDGSLRTTWQTITETAPSRAQVYVDLGASGNLTGAEFTFRRKSGARSYQIRVSQDKKTWTTVATFNYAEPLVWQRAQFNANGRYVQFLFFNTTNAASLGYLAEIKVYGIESSFGAAERAPTATSSPAPTSAPTETATPAPASPVPIQPTATVDLVETPHIVAASPVAVDHLVPITGFRRTANATTAEGLTDGRNDTVWHSTESWPASIYVVAEFGAVEQIATMEWLPGQAGIDGQMHVESSLNGVDWTLIAAPESGNPLEWQSLPVHSGALAIRVVITNPGQAEIIGGIAELRFIAPSEQAVSVAGR